MVARTFYKADGKLASSATISDRGPDIIPAEASEATLVGSATGKYSAQGPMHMPAIDIDLPCQLVESSTPGHFHLYIEKEISFSDYMDILKALCNAGIVQRGFYCSAITRGQTFLRLPGVRKEDT